MSSQKDHDARFILREQLYQECCAMTEYSLANGLSVPVKVVKAIEQVYDSLPSSIMENEADKATPVIESDIEPLINAHQILSNIVKPALPQTILLLDIEEKSNSWWNILGPVTIIRQLMVASFVSLFLFIRMALYPEVGQGAGDILDSNGLPLLKNLIFYISAAGLGSSFAALYKANSYITKRTFDPTHQTSYWIRFFLGLISGLVLAVMISPDCDTSQASKVGQNSDLLFDPKLFRVIVAMLGGFSADLLYTILTRFVETVESLFKGSTKNLVEMKQQEAETLLEASQLQSQIDLVTKLVKLQQDIGTSPNNDDIQGKIAQLVDDVMPNGNKMG